MTYDIASIDLPLGTVSAVTSRGIATQTETLLPLMDPVDIVDMSIEWVEVFLFQKNTLAERSNFGKVMSESPDVLVSGGSTNARTDPLEQVIHQSDIHIQNGLAG